MNALKSQAFWRGARRGLVQGGGVGSAFSLPIILRSLPLMMQVMIVAFVVMIAMLAFETGRGPR